MLWWVSWKAWIVSSSPAKRRFSKTLPAWRRSAMPSAMCSRKRWGCGWWMVLFAKTHLSQIVLLRMNCALKAFHFFFPVVFSAFSDPVSGQRWWWSWWWRPTGAANQTVNWINTMLNFCCENICPDPRALVFCGPLLNTMQSKVTIRVCEVFISFFPQYWLFLLMCCVFQAEYDAMLQEFAGEGIPLVAASVPADNFFPFLNDLLPFIMNKAVSPNALIHLGVWQEYFIPQHLFLFSDGSLLQSK